MHELERVLERQVRQFAAGVRRSHIVLLGVRRPALLTYLTGAVFLGAFLTRAAWFYRAPFHPDESTILWMALDALRDPSVPDHGLVSSFHVFQPPGLVWVTLPFVALGGGRPEFVIVAFALLNASAIALLVATVARSWGFFHAAALGTFLLVGPDAFYSAHVWHPSLYTAALCLMLTAGIRLKEGSSWWAATLVAIPGLYALIHYSGFILIAPAAVLLLLARKPLPSLLPPAITGAFLAVCAWIPFLVFENGRDWVDLRTLSDAADDSSTLRGKFGARLDSIWFAATHLGESVYGAVQLTALIVATVLFALLVAVVLRRWRDPGFALPAAMLASGLGAQVAVDQGERTDVLMLWHVPLYALAAWGLVQAVGLTRALFARRVVPAIVAAGLVSLVLAMGSSDLANSIRAVPYEDRLNAKWRAARAGTPVVYEAGLYPVRSVNRYYLPCDPPYDWGSEIWYLRDVLTPGAGRGAALIGGAFRGRAPPPCGRVWFRPPASNSRSSIRRWSLALAS